MKMQEVFDNYKEYIVPSYTKVPLIFVKGKGNYLWDVQGRKYLDFFPGWGVGNLGHCHFKVMCAVRDQISKLIFVPNNYFTLPQAQLAKELNFWTKEPFKVFYANSGAEANEAAIKLSRKFGNGRYEIITFENAFHGRTIGALSATGQAKYQQGFAPLVEGFKSVRFNDIAAVQAALGPQTAAVMLELVQGEGGINIATAEFVQSLRRLCDEKKLLLIIDEVQTGIGRTGTMFGWQQYGIVPDVFTLAKALGGGLPIGAMLARKELADLLTPGTHASTFGGGPVICKAALAVLRTVQQEKLLQNAKEAGAYLRAALENLKKKYAQIKDVRGVGLMCGVELTVPGKSVVEECAKNGLLINCTHDTVLRIMPALNITTREINKAVAILDCSLDAVLKQG
ncbi:MAG TPA: aspartate aminotransferase family protein [Candidatus Omnitrophota bacterium]|nr:aspartate aminotransferase family protein [Candidatus Omnitrophota bacterium]HRZ15838.1 aspartate aminotransferase family protein [Candidatus Omnitrophota bacterium]